MKAIVSDMIGTVHLKPNSFSERDNEAFYGESVEVLEEHILGYYKVRLHYRHEGWMPKGQLSTNERKNENWYPLPKRMVSHHFADVLEKPNVRGRLLVELTKGCVLAVNGEAENGWQPVRLLNGNEGFIREVFLRELPGMPDFSKEAELRGRLVSEALSYMGTQYRWGGKSPLGIDCSGLCAMALMLNGIVVFNGLVMLDRIRQNLAPPLREIHLESVKTGDLIYWPGHVAMYLDEGKFVHSSSSKNGVVINSLRPGDDDYDERLVSGIIGAASIFGN